MNRKSDNRHIERGLLTPLLLLVLTACGPSDPAEVQETAEDQSPAVQPRYTREYVFIGERADAPTAALFEFQVTDADSVLDRRTRGWLAYADTWDAFLDERWPSSGEAGVWSVLPHGELRIVVDIDGDLESVRYRRAAQSLELWLGEPLSVWSQGDDTRYRIIPSTLELGQDEMSGTVLEVLRARRITAGDDLSRGDYDRLFLTDGAGLHLVMAEAVGGDGTDERTFGWVLSNGDERVWRDVEVRWLEMRPLDEARRDIPLSWSLQIPSSDLIGEVESLGLVYTLGPEQAGRRSVEIRYTVEGWIELEGERRRIYGVLKHAQA